MEEKAFYPPAKFFLLNDKEAGARIAWFSWSGRVLLQNKKRAAGRFLPLFF
jgi:hypothetical protein